MKNSIAIIGLGKLGLCLALNLEQLGYSIHGVEKNERLLQAIQSKKLKSNEPEVESLLKSANHLYCHSAISQELIDQCPLLFVVVATPSLADGGYDHGQVNAILEELESLGRQKVQRHLIINCTTMPGYCASIEQRLEALNFSLTYNPEFIAQGSIIQDQRNPDQVLIGSTNDEAISKIKEVYSNLCLNNPQFCLMDLSSAEITKLATNCFLTSKISFANAIGDLALEIGANPEKILAAVGSDSRIGSKYLKYGFGYGGPCFPRDNRAMIKFASDHNHDLDLSRATDSANEKHLQFQFRQWMKIPSTETIEFDYLTYKKGTNILEESQQLKLALMLAKADRKVRIIESSSVIEKLKQSYGDLFEYRLRDGD